MAASSLLLCGASTHMSGHDLLSITSVFISCPTMHLCGCSPRHSIMGNGLSFVLVPTGLWHPGAWMSCCGSLFLVRSGEQPVL